MVAAPAIKFEEQTLKDKIRSIAKYPLGHIRERVLNEGSVAHEIVDEAISEYRKFMMLLASGNRKLAMCSKEVDEIWHNHILFTRDYAVFCESIFGEFVHHSPNTPGTPVTNESVDRFYTSYQNTFGQIPLIWNAQYWPCMLKSDCDGGLKQGCGDCGGKCVEEADEKKSNK